MPKAVRRALWGIFFTAASAAWLWMGLHTALNHWPLKPWIHERLESEVKRRGADLEIGDVEIDWLGRFTFGPVTVRRASGAPMLEADRVHVRPSYRALLAGRAVPASVSLGKVRVDVGERGEALRELLSDRPSSSAPPPAGPAKESGLAVSIDDLEVRGSLRGQPLRLGEATQVRLAVSRSGPERSVAGRLSLPGGAAAILAVKLSGADLQATARLDDFALRSLDEALWAGLPLRATDGKVGAKLEVTSPDRLQSGKVELSLSAKGLFVSGEELSQEPLGPAGGSLELHGSWDLPGGRISVESARAQLGDDASVGLSVDAATTLGEDPRFEFHVRADKVDYQKAVAALPPQLRPDDEICLRTTGTLSAQLFVMGPVRRPEDWDVVPKLDLSKLKRDKAAGPASLIGPFDHEAIAADGKKQKVRVGPESPTYVPLADLPQHVIRSILISEDAGFYGHDGFDFSEIKASVVAAVNGTRGIRGASTLTQQLAKNLFLTREKTYARKVREALLTLALEASVPKDRLLEIYLNVIEWGPGIYGIGAAARYYFGVEAKALAPKQGAFLGTIIPNPTRYHVLFERGALTPSWEQDVKAVLDRQLQLGYIDQATYDSAMAAPLAFRRPDDEAAAKPDAGQGPAPAQGPAAAPAPAPASP